MYFLAFQANCKPIFLPLRNLQGRKKLNFAVLTVLKMLNLRQTWIKPFSSFFCQRVYYYSFYKPTCRICCKMFNYFSFIFCHYFIAFFYFNYWNYLHARAHTHTHTLFLSQQVHTLGKETRRQVMWWCLSLVSGQPGFQGLETWPNVWCVGVTGCAE